MAKSKPTNPARKDAGSSPPDMAQLYHLPGHLIRRAQQISTAIFVEEMIPLDLTPVQYAIMTAIASTPGIEATRVSQLVAFDRSTLGDVLDRLTTKGWLERKPSATDRRVKCLWLTANGLALLEAAGAAVARTQTRILDPLPESERGPCIAMLRRLVGLHTGETRYLP